MSLSSTCKNTPCGGSPKSPPNSPNVGLADYRDLKEQLKTQGVFINREPEPSMDDILSSTGNFYGSFQTKSVGRNSSI